MVYVYPGPLYRSQDLQNRPIAVEKAPVRGRTEHHILAADAVGGRIRRQPGILHRRRNRRRFHAMDQFEICQRPAKGLGRECHFEQSSHGLRPRPFRLLPQRGSRLKVKGWKSATRGRNTEETGGLRGLRPRGSRLRRLEKKWGRPPACHWQPGRLPHRRLPDRLNTYSRFFYFSLMVDMEPPW